MVNFTFCSCAACVVHSITHWLERYIIFSVIGLGFVHAGCPVNVCDVSGQTPLHIAVEKQSMHMMKLLLDHKADPAIADYNNETALNIALALCWIEGYKYLLSHCYEGEGSEALRKSLKQAVKGKKDQLAAEKIRKFPPSE